MNKGVRMRKVRIILLLFALLLCPLLAMESFAQPGMMWKGSGGWGMGSQYGRMYDPKTVEVVSGEVVTVDLIAPMRGMSHGMHVLLKTAKGNISVHLGPTWYLENQDVKINVNDKIEAKGSRIVFNGSPALIAAEIKKGEEVLKLRDENGYPVWSGWRRR